VLDVDFNLKIVDFGLAALATDVQVCGGLMYSGVGSLPYSAPEVVLTKKDNWSGPLGLLLKRTVSGNGIQRRACRRVELWSNFVCSFNRPSSFCTSIDENQWQKLETLQTLLPFK